MQSQDPASLSNLHDIVAPAPVPYWPPAPGWYAAGGALLLALAFIAWKAWRRWRANAYRRAAQAELARLESEHAWERLSELLKRTALAAFPRTEVAALSGTAWLEFLDRTGGTSEFTSGAARRVCQLAFEPGAAERLAEDEANEIVRICRTWLQRHRSED